MIRYLIDILPGLFHKAISMSGSATSGWAINRNPMLLAQELTRLLGCGETKTSQQVYDCVRSADARILGNITDEVINESLFLFSSNSYADTDTHT